MSEAATFTSGAKSSERAPRYDLIVLPAIHRLVARLEYGAARHGENNYQRGVGDAEYYRDRVNHLVGHAMKLAAGDRSEDHLGAIMANCGILAYFDAAAPSAAVHGTCMEPAPQRGFCDFPISPCAGNCSGKRPFSACPD